MGVSADEEIYLKCRCELMRYANALVGPDGAADVVRTVVTKAFCSGRSLGDLREPRTYLMRAVLNESLRRDKHSSEAPTLLARSIGESRPEVLQAVAVLPPFSPGRSQDESNPRHDADTKTAGHHHTRPHRHLCTGRPDAEDRSDCRLWAGDCRFLSPICGCSMLYQGEGLMRGPGMSREVGGVSRRHQLQRGWTPIT